MSAVKIKQVRSANGTVALPFAESGALGPTQVRPPAPPPAPAVPRLPRRTPEVLAQSTSAGHFVSYSR